MGKHHSDDYKETAIKYYMTTNDSLRNTCAIFGCCHTSLTRQINQYEENGNVKRKQRNNKNIKVLPQRTIKFCFVLDTIHKQIKHYVRKSSPLNYAEIYKTLEDIFKTKVKKSHLHNYFKHVFMKIEK